MPFESPETRFVAALEKVTQRPSLEIDGLLTGTLEIARKAGVAAPFTESLAGLARLRAESTGQYK